MKKITFLSIFFIFSTLIYSQEIENSTKSDNSLIIKGIDLFNQKDFVNSNEIFEQVLEDSIIASIYKAKIQLEFNNPLNAELILLNSKKNVEKSTNDSFYSTLLQCIFRQEKWDEVQKVYKKIKNPDESSNYAYSFSFFQKAEYSKVLKSNENRLGNLYALSLCKQNQFEKANEVFGELYEKNQLLQENHLNYANSLFYCNDFQKSYEILKICDDEQTQYLQGLCKTNLQEWENAINHFGNYIKLMSNKKSINPLCFFYKGYCEYCLGELKNSYASFLRFCSESKENSTLKRKSYEFTAKICLENKDFQNAVIQAENFYKNSFTQNDIQESVVFCVSVFSDAKEYEKALDLIENFCNGKTDFSVECRFLKASIYQKKGDIILADKTYNSIYKEFPKSKWAEESLFRCGEVFYQNDDFSTALNRFNNFVYKFPSGKFSDVAFYYAGDCSLRIGDFDRCIMMNKTLISRFKDSVYIYGALKNLMESYAKQNDYDLALQTAHNIEVNFSELAKNDNLYEKIDEFNQFLGGTEYEISVLQKEYENLGKSTTKQGRITGTKLVQKINENKNNENLMIELANEILENQTENDELEFACQNLKILCEYYQKIHDNQNSINFLLKSAEINRMIANEIEAAKSLYSATEILIEENQMANAKETAELLKKIYPNSRHAQFVDNLF